MSTSPTARTLRECRDRGWVAEVVERWIPYYIENGEQSKRGVRKDLFGFIDIVALTPNGILAIQACANSSLSKRVDKIRYECNEVALLWLDSGGLISCWGWKRYKKPVERKWWRVTERAITFDVLKIETPF